MRIMPLLTRTGWAEHKQEVTPAQRSLLVYKLDATHVVVDERERLEVVLHGGHVLLLAAGVRVEDLPDGGREAHVHGQRDQVRDVDEDALLELEAAEHLLLGAVVHEGGAEGLQVIIISEDD